MSHGEVTSPSRPPMRCARASCQFRSTSCVALSWGCSFKRDNRIQEAELSPSIAPGKAIKRSADVWSLSCLTSFCLLLSWLGSYCRLVLQWELCPVRWRCQRDPWFLCWTWNLFHRKADRACWWAESEGVRLSKSWKKSLFFLKLHTIVLLN